MDSRGAPAPAGTVVASNEHLFFLKIYLLQTRTQSEGVAGPTTGSLPTRPPRLELSQALPPGLPHTCRAEDWASPTAFPGLGSRRWLGSGAAALQAAALPARPRPEREQARGWSPSPAERDGCLRGRMHHAGRGAEPCPGSWGGAGTLSSPSPGATAAGRGPAPGVRAAPRLTRHRHGLVGSVQIQPLLAGQGARPRPRPAGLATTAEQRPVPGVWGPQSPPGVQHPRAWVRGRPGPSPVAVWAASGHPGPQCGAAASGRAGGGPARQLSLPPPPFCSVAMVALLRFPVSLLRTLSRVCELSRILR